MQIVLKFKKHSHIFYVVNINPYDVAANTVYYVFESNDNKPPTPTIKTK